METIVNLPKGVARELEQVIVDDVTAAIIREYNKGCEVKISYPNIETLLHCTILAAYRFTKNPKLY